MGHRSVIVRAHSTHIIKSLFGARQRKGDPARAYLSLNQDFRSAVDWRVIVHLELSLDKGSPRSPVTLAFGVEGTCIWTFWMFCEMDPQLEILNRFRELRCRVERAKERNVEEFRSEGVPQEALAEIESKFADARLPLAGAI